MLQTQVRATFIASRHTLKIYINAKLEEKKLCKKVLDQTLLV